jgi:hypothetical protein
MSWILIFPAALDLLTGSWLARTAIKQGSVYYVLWPNQSVKPLAGNSKPESKTKRVEKDRNFIQERPLEMVYDNSSFIAAENLRWCVKVETVLDGTLSPLFRLFQPLDHAA